jgi:hypothetical protein
MSDAKVPPSDDQAWRSGDEVRERVARALARHGSHLDWDEDLTEEAREYWRRDAETALAALAEAPGLAEVLAEHAHGYDSDCGTDYGCGCGVEYDFDTSAACNAPLFMIGGMIYGCIAANLVVLNGTTWLDAREWGFQREARRAACWTLAAPFWPITMIGGAVYWGAKLIRSAIGGRP